ncbi:MAG: GNAT family N-acetyltransferase [Chloroflexota bacterium]
MRKHSLRPARMDEADLLTDIAMRSKAVHGYGAEFIAACREDMTLTTDLMPHTTVIEVDAEVCGLYALVPVSPITEAHLDFMFVAPEHIGKGYGRLLWRHAIDRARTEKMNVIWIVSDPFAVPFYTKMGAQQVKTVLSSCIEGRTLPLMRFDFTKS